MSGRRYTWEEVAADPKLWVAVLWHAMSITGKGYRRHSLRRTGRGDDRRPDKPEGPTAGSPFLRRYAQRYASVPHKQGPRQRSRARAALGI